MSRVWTLVLLLPVALAWYDYKAGDEFRLRLLSNMRLKDVKDIPPNAFICELIRPPVFLKHTPKIQYTLLAYARKGIKC